MKSLSERPSFTIEKDGSPYLTRWWLSPSTEKRYHERKHRPALLLHHIWRPDCDRAPHDHPWWFVSLVLKGWYLENRYNADGYFTHQVRRRRFSIGFRRSTDLHDIREVSPNLWTLVLVGPKCREWGFMTNDGWVHWKDYIADGWTDTTTTVS